MRGTSKAVFVLASLLPLVVDAGYGKSSSSSKHSSTIKTSTTKAPTSIHTSSSASGTATAACAIVSSLSAAQRAVAPAATPIVDATLAYNCLNSVALNQPAAIQLVDSMEPYIQWQSDLAYLKNPPSTYFYPPHDPLGYLANVRANLVANKYANEYAFQKDLYQIFARSHDGHFVMYPDLLSKAFEWGRQIPLVSISKDGKELPKIYSLADIQNNPATASALVKIDGVEASKYVADFAYTASFNQDADAAFNSMFFKKAFQAGGVGNGYFSRNGRVRYIYPGPTTTFTWANGTTETLANQAYVKGDLTGVVDGPSFYKKFCVPVTPKSTPTADAPSVAATGPPGYPPAVISTNDTIVSGYYLDGAEYKDIAVLSLLAMENESPAEFQAVVQTFLADAKAAGKKKIIVDLSANGGGYILQGYDLFRQFFPKTVQRDYTRFREHPAFLDISKIFSRAIPANYDPSTASETTIEFYENWFNYRYDYNLTEQPFKTFDDKFAPHIYAGDPYTNIVRWNFNDPLTTINSTFGFGIDITGYGSRKNFKQPFAAEDIILLYDGYCASTCIIFSEFMIHDAGVRSIAMGGRPSYTPIQGMGGVKGAQSFSWQNIFDSAQQALPLATAAEATVLNKLTTLPIQRSSASSVNLRDLIIPSELNEGVPAQVLAEDADCRLFYTADMVTDVTKLWEVVADTAWGSGKCVVGSLNKYGKRDEEEEGVQVKREAVAQRAAMVGTKSVAVEADERVLSEKFGRKVIS